MSAARLATCAIAVLLLGGLAASARADFGVANLDGQISRADGSPYTQAGGHPYEVSAEIKFNVAPTDPSEPTDAFWPAEPVKDVLVDVPPGLVGDPTVVAQCSLDELASSSSSLLCPSASQVGVASVDLPYCLSPGRCVPFTSVSPVPIFNMVPPPSVPARFAFNISGVIVTLDAALRSGSDYGLSVAARNVSEGLPIIGADLTLWGVPADPSHTSLRLCRGQLPPPTGPSGAAGVPPRAFLRLPTACTADGQGLVTTARVDSWSDPGDYMSASFESHLPPGLVPGTTFAENLFHPGPDPYPGTALRGPPQGATGCDRVPFDAELTAQPDTSASPGAAGWTFDLMIPQDAITDPDEDAIAQSDVRKAVVTLPEGVRVSPAAADGLGACSPAQIGLHSTADAACPDASKIGTVTIDTPLLDDQLTGALYLATPHDNPSGSLLALYLVARGPGLIVKLPGSIAPNATTGQLVATFDDDPQLPFSHLHMHFFGGARAPLSNPPRCGTYTTSATLTSWSGKVVQSDSSFTTSHDGKGAPCPPPQFTPALAAGTTSATGGVPSGGSHSSFSLHLSRDDDDEELAALESVDLPQGLFAKIAGVPLCPEAKAAAGTCEDASRIGSVTAAAGPGPSPISLGGRVYLGGPYKGAPFSLAIVVPAIAGPFDLGNVVVRSAIVIDPSTAKISVVTDPLPTILEGIPLQVRLVEVRIDRPDFIVNPTSCSPKAIGATVRSTAGTIAKLGTRFQVASCATLPLTPKLRLVVGARHRTRFGVSTPLTVTLTQPPGQSGLRTVGVTLPSSLNAIFRVVEAACTRDAFEAGNCGKAKVGTATAVTPLLEHPLKGGVYLVKHPAGGLPDLVVALRGQVDVDLTGTVRIPASNRLGATFETVPDVPIRTFVLRLVAGRRGAVGVAVPNLCKPAVRRQVAQVAFRGQNGKLVQSSQPLEVRGCPKRTARRTHAGHDVDGAREAARLGLPALMWSASVR